MIKFYFFIIKMDRVSGLNANQVAKELQGYKRYQAKTQKEIKDKLGGVNDLRDELRRLEKKHDKTIKQDKKVNKTKHIDYKIFIIKNKEYTEDKLYEMIQYYESQHNPVYNTIQENIINKDTWLNVLLQSDTETLKTSCFINKDTDNICNDLQFWKLKFEQDNLPFLLKKDTLENYIKNYNKIKKIKPNIIKLYDNVLLNKKYNVLSINDTGDINDMKWLPAKMIESIDDHPDDVSEGTNIEFDFKKSTITLYYIATDEDEEDLKEKLEIKIKLTKDEFINYLVKFYYNEEDAALTDGDNLYIDYESFMNDKTMKFYLPKW
jgi:hypothetical protein